MKSGCRLSPPLAFITDIDSVGLETAQGLRWPKPITGTSTTRPALFPNASWNA
jgi:hypothetical protein